MVYLARRARGACERPDRSAGLTSWRCPFPLLAVTLYIRLICPPRSQEPLPPLPPPPGSSRLRHRGRGKRAPQSPTTINYTVEFPLFEEIAEVNTPECNG
ncbi:uncharacterized protein LOC122451179 isoform X1 [Cervus canadensis]|uniref:uncharacterized protein LOC122451179 isoform X1 n=1 Tax=Cervus canadensis TaxID=1574408 RepID=UPI001C9E22BD|nr:uncharacterized protein LOC122451179 isoform X1 [Cervus canadensis]XP_043339716.1 uncharacterized protein LOC122451179 isoform X1 [Cervus canadensis]